MGSCAPCYLGQYVLVEYYIQSLGSSEFIKSIYRSLRRPVCIIGQYVFLRILWMHLQTLVGSSEYIKSICFLEIVDAFTDIGRFLYISLVS